MSGYAYFKPKDLAEALELMESHPHARFVAGGTDLLVRIRHRELRPAALISLRTLPELRGITPGDDERSTRIGAATTISELLADEHLQQTFPLLCQAAARLAGPQIRNAATLGGNLCNCSPCADTAGPLLVHQARVRLRSPQGERELELSEFFQGPGQTCSPPDEILSEVLLDRPPRGARAAFFKKGRVRMDLALVSVSALVAPDGGHIRWARLAAGSAAPVPLRLEKTERLVSGAQVNPTLLSEAQRQAEREVAPIDDLRASADYRRRLVGVYVRRALEQLTSGGQP